MGSLWLSWYIVMTHYLVCIRDVKSLHGVIILICYCLGDILYSAFGNCFGFVMRFPLKCILLLLLFFFRCKMFRLHYNGPRIMLSVSSIPLIKLGVRLFIRFDCIIVSVFGFPELGEQIKYLVFA